MSNILDLETLAAVYTSEISKKYIDKILNSITLFSIAFASKNIKESKNNKNLNYMLDIMRSLIKI